MRRELVIIIVLLTAGIALHLPAAAQQVYEGVCDASAAIAVGATHFLVAEDENDVLWIYRNDKPRNKPIGGGFDLSSKLRTDPKRESDIEGAARVGDHIYWITSHGRNRKGKLRENRNRLFATKIAGTPADLRLKWVGRYDYLIRDMLNPIAWTNPDAPMTVQTIILLERATQPHEKVARKLAPKDKGLNIEALAALPTGSGLLIGLRNPISGGKALILSLMNPEALVTGKEAVSRFDAPILLNLHGLGLRAMAYSSISNAFLLVAGPSGSGGPFKLFRWSGNRDAAPVLLRKLQSGQGSHPEAIVIYPDTLRIQILNDEGSRLINGTTCKKANEEMKSFSDRWLHID
jgi:hypothetical protein